MEPNPYYWARIYWSRRRVDRESTESYLLWRGPWAD